MKPDTITDEQIFEIASKHIEWTKPEHGLLYDDSLLSFARALLSAQPAERAELHNAALAVMAVPELAEIACTGSDAPAEHALGSLADALNGAALSAQPVADHRNAVIEECAKVCDIYGDHWKEFPTAGGGFHAGAATNLAASIRALKDTTPQPQVGSDQEAIKECQRLLDEEGQDHYLLSFVAGWQAAIRCKAAQVGSELPPLPEYPTAYYEQSALGWFLAYSANPKALASVPLFTADQMRDYARAACSQQSAKTDAQMGLCVTDEKQGSERERFEAWFRKRNKVPDWFPLSIEGTPAADMLEAWQARAAQAQATPEGYKLVPIEPTEAMVQATRGRNMSDPTWDGYARKRHATIYRQMLAAAPSAQTDKENNHG
jgi:hypothetical protein